MARLARYSHCHRLTVHGCQPGVCAPQCRGFTHPFELCSVGCRRAACKDERNERVLDGFAVCHGGHRWVGSLYILFNVGGGVWPLVEVSSLVVARGS